MNASIVNEFGRARPLYGPADLREYGEGDTLIIRGTVTAVEQARWAAAVMGFIARGGKIG